jgi:hypothetical protein
MEHSSPPHAVNHTSGQGFVESLWRSVDSKEQVLVNPIVDEEVDKSDRDDHWNSWAKSHSNPDPVEHVGISFLQGEFLSQIQSLILRLLDLLGVCSVTSKSSIFPLVKLKAENREDCKSKWNQNFEKHSNSNGDSHVVVEIDTKIRNTSIEQRHIHEAKIIPEALFIQDLTEVQVSNHQDSNCIDVSEPGSHDHLIL